MIKKYYLSDLKNEYDINIDVTSFKRRLNKFFPIEKEMTGRKRNYIEAEEQDVIKAIETLKKDIELFNIKHNMKNPIEKFQSLIATLPNKDKFPFTFKTFYEFTIEKIIKSQSATKTTIAGIAYITLQYLFNTLSDDNCYVENEEILKLFIRKTSGQQQIQLSNYLNYLKENYEDRIVFTLNNQISIKRFVKDEEDFYTDEQWFQYKKYICDIDKHIMKAFEDRIYSRYWLFILLHLSLAWRKNDILNFPRLENLDANRYTLDWFYSNEFTMEDAVYIISNTKLVAEQYYTDKTDAKLHFNIPVSLMIPTAIALIICEQWARKNDENILFGFKNVKKKIIKKLFGENMNGFSSIKANRTLLSLANRAANELDISKSISIASYMRSHKMGYSNASDTTNVYLKSNYDDSELHSITKTLFEKGAFGWLFDYAVGCFDEQTKSIFKTYDIEVLEQTSSYLLSERCTQEKVIKELISYSKDELVEVLSGKRTSKQENVYCIKTYCDKNLQNDCLECPYSIPTIYSMYSVASEINSILEKLCKDDNKSKRDKDRYLYRLLKLLSIAKTFKETFGIHNSILFLDYDNALIKTKNILNGGNNNDA